MNANTDAVADAFASVLREWLKPDEFRAMKTANETDPDYATSCCASQDYCDANMAMHEAFLRVLKREPDIDNEADTDLWNAAWESARRRHIGHQ